MKIEILHVPDCPNLDLLHHRVREILDESTEVTRRVVADVDTAAAVGMTGSPTLLIDGTDPFARRGSEPSLSCRLYPSEDGRVQGAPSMDDLRRVLAIHQQYDDAADTQCCSSTAGPATLLDTRQRAAPIDPAERAVHRAILRAFAATGQPPATTELDTVTQPEPALQVLRRLHDADVIRLDPTGGIRAAYPFSSVPTRHHVRLATGTEVYAMCVIDALGMPAMLDTDAVITTTDPTTDHPITVTIANGQSIWDPTSAVVFVGAQASAGPSADTCCDHLNAFTDHQAAEHWTRAHPHITGDIVSPIRAELLGQQIFGQLLI
jgi:hypothetical protein